MFKFTSTYHEPVQLDVPSPRGLTQVQLAPGASCLVEAYAPSAQRLVAKGRVVCQELSETQVKAHSAKADHKAHLRTVNHAKAKAALAKLRESVFPTSEDKPKTQKRSAKSDSQE